METDQSQPAAQPGVPMRRRELWLDLAPDDYPEHRFKMWVNHPPRLRQQILTAETEIERRAALVQIALEHNDWLDFDDRPYPPMNTTEFWEVIPSDIAMAVLHHITTSAFTLPNSLRGNRTN